MPSRKGRGRPGRKPGAAAERNLLDDPEFKALVAERSRFAWTLSGAMVAVYLVFILLVAFDGGLMATTIGDGPTTLGIVIGLGVIVFAFALTGVYVGRANGRFDELTARLKGNR